MSDSPVRAGVIGVGSMGENHARVYRDLEATELTGVFDVDGEAAAAVADSHDTRALEFDELLDAVDVASIAVPTSFHYDVATSCIREGVDILVEKPFVADAEEGRELIERAEANDVTIQVGHVERFNPAVSAVRDLVDDDDIISVSARRLGPPPERDIEDTAVMDLMIHDVDVVLDLIDDELWTYDAVSAADGRHATASLAFDSGVVGRLTASRVTQEKVRELVITARDRRVKVDYIDQTVEIHRSSTPEFLEGEGDVHYRHENVVERVTVDREEPLKNELRAFVEAASAGTTPVVTAEDGLTVLQVTRALDRAAATTEEGRLADVEAD
jgi:predicted dehydrogenase